MTASTTPGTCRNRIASCSVYAPLPKPSGNSRVVTWLGCAMPAAAASQISASTVEAANTAANKDAEKLQTRINAHRRSLDVGGRDLGDERRQQRLHHVEG